MRYILFFLLSSPLFGALSLDFATTLSTGTNTLPQVSSNSLGQSAFVWITQYPATIQARIFHPPRSFSQTTTLANGNFPQVGIDAFGNAIAVWINPFNQIEASNYRDGAWSTPQQLSRGGINSAPQIAVNTLGNAIVVWSTPLSNQVLGATYNSSSRQWSSFPIVISYTRGSFVQVSLDEANQGFVIWQNSGVIETAKVGITD